VATTVRETERKYEAADGVELPGWSGLAGVESQVGPEEQKLEAVYHDAFTYGLLYQQQTDAGRLHEGGITQAWRDLRRSVRKLAE
jgi:hypothetical protein